MKGAPEAEGTSRAAGYALVACAAASWGTWPVFLRKAADVSPLNAGLEATVVMGIITIVSGFACLRDRVDVRPTRAQWIGALWLGVGDALNVLLLFAAYQRTSVEIAVLTHYLTPILVAVSAPFVLGERVHRRTAGAVGLSFFGLLLLLRPWSADRHPGDWEGAALGAGSAVFYASNVLVNKRLVGAFSGSELAFFHGLVATPLLALTVPWGAWGADPAAIGIVAAGAVLPGALGGLLFVWGLRRIAASHATTLTLLEPLVAVVLAATVLGEGVKMDAGVGALLILGGAAIVVTSPGAARAART